jgi:3-deoxy-D-arabino-heptulosonate 7-phosphate (DAHP) synthase
MYQKFKFFSNRVDLELKSLIFECDQKFWANFKRKSYGKQILLKLKLKVKLTYRILVDFEWKNSKKQFKNQNSYIFFNHLA